MAGRPRPSSSRRPAARGGRPARASGGSGPTIAAILVVVGVVALIVILTMGKGKKKPEASTASSSTSGQPAETQPPGPTKLAPPPLPGHLKQEAQTVVARVKELSEQGERIYTEAVEAKHRDDLDAFQQYLEEASLVYGEINDIYNEFISQMPTNADWDEEQVANFYLGREASTVQRALSRYADIRKQRASGH